MTAAPKYVTTRDRKVAQHMLGTEFAPDTNLIDAMDIAKLMDWNVRLAPAQGVLEDGTVVSVPGKFAVVRDNPYDRGPRVEALGVGVTSKFHITQNEDVANFLTTLLDVEPGKLTVDAGTAFANGTRAFLSLKLDGDALIGGVDQVENYLLAHWAHDGSAALSFGTHSVRIACTNQLRGVLGRELAQTFKIRHIGKGMRGRVQEAREVLGLAQGEVDAFTVIANQWAEAELTKRKFDRIVAQLLPNSPEDAPKVAVERRQEQQATFRHLATEGAANANLGLTAWNVANAWGEFIDWSGTFKDGERRAISQLGLDGTMEARKSVGAHVIADVAGLVLAA